MGEREVTNAQFRKFKESHNSGSIGNQSLDLDKQPVVRVTWDGRRGVLQLAVRAGRSAARVCRQRAGRRGHQQLHADQAGHQRLSPAHRGRVGIRGARAAGAGKPLRYPWGQDLPVVSGTANWAGSEAVGLLGAALEGHRDEFPAAAAPALFPPNAMGFYDFAATCPSGQRQVPFVRAVVAGQRSARPRRQQGSYVSRFQLAYHVGHGAAFPVA
jgi:hypothetical protein